MSRVVRAAVRHAIFVHVPVHCGRGPRTVSGFFGKSQQALQQVEQQQTTLRQVVVKGELRMAAGVAEQAAARCELGAAEIWEHIQKRVRLTWRR